MKYGLRDEDLAYIISVISNFPEVERAVIFGSRAKGNEKPASDIDIAIFGEQVSFSTLSGLHSQLEEQSPLPYLFDIIDYTHTDHQKLKEHIDRIGKTIYVKQG